jgi:hypothetical protein
MVLFFLLFLFVFEGAIILFLRVEFATGNLLKPNNPVNN